MAGKVEIDEADWLAHQNLAKVVDGIMANPEARTMVLKARKIADPNARVPELDAAAPVQTEISELRKQMSEFLTAQQKRDIEAEERARLAEFTNQWEARKTGLRQQGYNNDYIEGVEKLAHERGIADLDAAAALFDKMNPPQEIVQPNGFGTWDFFDTPGSGDDFIKKLVETRGEDDRLVLAEANKALAEVRGNSNGVRR